MWSLFTSVILQSKKQTPVLTCRAECRFDAPAGPRFWTTRSSYCCRNVPCRPCEWCV